MARKASSAAAFSDSLSFASVASAPGLTASRQTIAELVDGEVVSGCEVCFGLESDPFRRPVQFFLGEAIFSFGVVGGGDGDGTKGRHLVANEDADFLAGE